MDNIKGPNPLSSSVGPSGGVGGGAGAFPSTSSRCSSKPGASSRCTEPGVFPSTSSRYTEPKNKSSASLSTSKTTIIYLGDDNDDDDDFVKPKSQFRKPTQRFLGKGRRTSKKK
jgi:hypothetical protein